VHEFGTWASRRDHYGLAAPIVEEAGCELWMHPNHAHMTRALSDPDRALERRVEVARQSGVPLEPLRRWAEERREQPPSIAGVVEPHRDLVTGVEVETGAGTWTTYETPGHAPSHVSLFEPKQRLLISGDHVLGRVSLYFDYGWTPDPVAEFLTGLDTVDELGARLCLPGHGRTFSDVRAHIHANRTLVAERVQKVLDAIATDELTAFEVIPHVYGEAPSAATGNWWLSETLAYLRHLEGTGRARRIKGEPERWTTL